MQDDPVLVELGFTDEFAAAYAAADGGPGAFPGRVARLDRGGWLTVLTARGARRARQHPRFRRVMDALDLPTVGDWVVVRPDPGGGPPLVEEVLERRSVFVRADEGHARAQAVAANVDVVLLLLSLTAVHEPRRTDRLLSLAWASGAQPVVVLTKADTAEHPAARAAEVRETVVGVPVHVVSALRGDGLEDLRRYAGRGRTTALVGASGVGKSTLANRLLGADDLATGEVRRDGEGRHTTTHRQLLRVPGGGLLIDTPGLRSVGLLEREHAADDQTFADIEALAAECRFANCSHGGEPGCAVGTALEDGTLDPARWERSVVLSREAEAAARRRREADKAAETRRSRARRRDGSR